VREFCIEAGGEVHCFGFRLFKRTVGPAGTSEHKYTKVCVYVGRWVAPATRSA
jgi:hypothetical protein